MVNTWTSDSSIVSDLGDVGSLSRVAVFNDGGTLKLISGEFNGVFTGWYWSGSAWILDASIVSGLGDVGNNSSPTVFNDGGTWKLISGERGNIFTFTGGVFTGWYWSGSAWILDASIVSGLGDVGNMSAPVIFNDGGTWKLISGERWGTFIGWYWSGSAWILDASIVSGLGDVGNNSSPTVFNDGGTWKLISGSWHDDFYGYYWDGSNWILDSSIISGLTSIGDYCAPVVFDDDGTWKLISGEDDGAFFGWYKTPTTFTLSGTISDEWGNPIHDADITISNGTTYTTTSDENGDYSQVVDSDTYDIAVSKSRSTYHDITVSSVAVTADTTQDITMLLDKMLGRLNAIKGISIPGGISMGRSRR